MTDDEYINEYHCFGEKVGKIAYDTEKTEWFSCLKPICLQLKKQSVEIENWDETDVLRDLFINSVSDFCQRE